MYGCEGTFEYDTNKAVGKIEISIKTENVESARVVLFSSSITDSYEYSSPENIPIVCTTGNLVIDSRNLFSQITLLG